jgi:hypothetical protein
MVFRDYKIISQVYERIKFDCTRGIMWYVKLRNNQYCHMVLRNYRIREKVTNNQCFKKRTLKVQKHHVITPVLITMQPGAKNMLLKRQRRLKAYVQFFFFRIKMTATNSSYTNSPNFAYN